MRPIDADALEQSYLDTDKNAETIKWQEDKLKAGEDNDFFFGFYTAVEIFRDLINEAPTVGGWISVKERLPNLGKDVLVLVGADMFVMALARKDQETADIEWVDAHGYIAEMWEVTHWCASPEPPEETKGEEE